MTQIKMIKILSIVLVIILAGTAGYFAFAKKYWRSGVTPRSCTMEAKQCPDGSYVSRSGPNCEFAACPTPSPSSKTKNVVKRVGEREGAFLIQKINYESV